MRGRVSACHLINLRWLSASAVPEQQEEEQDGAQQQQKEPVKKAPESNAWQELLDRKLHKLDMDVRRTGRAGLYDFENVLSNVEKGLKCTANQVKLTNNISVFSMTKNSTGASDTTMLWVCFG